MAIAPECASVSTWIAVLVKGFDSAKGRLAPALTPVERARLAARTAERALRAAAATAPAIAVCGSQEAAELARALGVDAVVEEAPSGQNPAGDRAISEAAARGAEAVLLLSADLPLVSEQALRAVLAAAPAEGDVMVAVAAEGRGGTNALLLRPPEGVVLQFGDRSLNRFEAEAARLGRRFVVHDSPELALDLDTPEDLAALFERTGAGA